MKSNDTVTQLSRCLHCAGHPAGTNTISPRRSGTRHGANAAAPGSVGSANRAVRPDARHAHGPGGSPRFAETRRVLARKHVPQHHGVGRNAVEARRTERRRAARRTERRRDRFASSTCPPRVSSSFAASRLCATTTARSTTAARSARTESAPRRVRLSRRATRRRAVPGRRGRRVLGTCAERLGGPPTDASPPGTEATRRIALLRVGTRVAGNDAPVGLPTRVGEGRDASPMAFVNADVVAVPARKITRRHCRRAPANRDFFPATPSSSSSHATTRRHSKRRTLGSRAVSWRSHLRSDVALSLRSARDFRRRPSAAQSAPSPADPGGRHKEMGWRLASLYPRRLRLVSRRLRRRVGGPLFETSRARGHHTRSSHVRPSTVRSETPRAASDAEGALSHVIERSDFFFVHVRQRTFGRRARRALSRLQPRRRRRAASRTRRPSTRGRRTSEDPEAACTTRTGAGRAARVAVIAAEADGSGSGSGSGDTDRSAVPTPDDAAPTPAARWERFCFGLAAFDRGGRGRDAGTDAAKRARDASAGAARLGQRAGGPRIEVRSSTTPTFPPPARAVSSSERPPPPRGSRASPSPPPFPQRYERGGGGLRRPAFPRVKPRLIVRAALDAHVHSDAVDPDRLVRHGRGTRVASESPPRGVRRVHRVLGVPAAVVSASSSISSRSAAADDPRRDVKSRPILKRRAEGCFVD